MDQGSHSASPSAIRRSLKRAEAGLTLSVAEVETLLQARGAELERLCAAAARKRDARLVDIGRAPSGSEVGATGADPSPSTHPGGTLTYSRKVFIPLTRLCRDRCHYCTFVAAPAALRAEGTSLYMEPDEVVELARRGAERGCKEALFTLGDRPEDRWPEARQWLDERGYDSTLDYVRAMAIRVLEETGLLPHLNPGVMSWAELSRLKPVAPSMGMMLETTSRDLFETKGKAHYGSPDKDPEVRLRTLTDAGRLAIPFTTGILVGIGETITDRAESLVELARLGREFGHIQEVIVQNFRAKEHTAMADSPDAEIEEYRAAIACARIVLDPRIAVQAPPNLVEANEISLLVGAGIDDFGGISPLTADHVNPERPWPHLADLERICADLGFSVRERLTVHSRYIAAGSAWIDPRVAGHVSALADADGLAAPAVGGGSASPEPRPWQEPDEPEESYGRVDLNTEIDTEGRRTETRSDIDQAFGNWDAIREAAERIGAAEAARGTRSPERADSEVLAALRAAEAKPEGLTDEQYLALAGADGHGLAALAALADGVRRDVVGDEITYIVNRNINFTNICYTGCRFCAFAQRKGDADAFSLSPADVADRAFEAHSVGATEVCM
ncbi:7,8-didemethyl-8-hydroxy-5-deazariboflavin synthase CofG, partial [Dietzia sp.]|uniref:7,8-didemethyl-8-hydroxy-5-deazariboflavin synthase CofG n=1 Tax=Dietzia sp. TaxID=1871616 RepID=UPI002FDA0F1F